MEKIRLRFAPSPTGFVHMGSLRTVLFDYLLAKRLKGELILRIEDTDQTRLVDGSLENLLKILSWLKIEFDEGPHKPGKYGPYIQSERIKTYHKYIEQLIDNGSAYYCFCTKERLEEMRDEQIKEKKAPRYDKKCRFLSKEEVSKNIEQKKEYVIRQKMPETGEVIVFDEIRKEIKFKASDLEDQVLLKSDGMPTYQLASVIDDHLMKISHVSRGEEWIPSLPKNVLLYQAFNWQVPKFIHFPLILNKTGGKLSKRQGDVFVEDFKNQGFLPEALINFSALLGWHAQDDNELYTLKKLEKEFSLERIGASPAVFDIEKLKYFNSYYIKKLDLNKLTELSLPFLIQAKLINFNPSSEELKLSKKVLSLAQERVKTLAEVPELFSFFFKKIDYNKELLKWKNLEEKEIKNNLEIILNLLKNEENWTISSLESLIINYIKTNSLKNGDFLWPLRVALSGQKFSPSPFENAWALGKSESLDRIKLAISKLN